MVEKDAREVVVSEVHKLNEAVDYVFCLVTKQKSQTTCLTLCNPVDCSPPGSSVCEISQAGILEWVAISFSRVSS